MADRVEKDWKRKGLSGYSEGAILGTLEYFGVAIDEAGFKTLAKDRTLLSITRDWANKHWKKGSKHFDDFPVHAGAELWKRWVPERLSSFEFAEAIRRVLYCHHESEDRSELTRAIDYLATLPARVPTEENERTQFFEEAMSCFLSRARKDDERLSELSHFHHLATQLAAENCKEEALKFAAVYEFIVPLKKDVTTAKARAMLHDTAGIRALEAIAADSKRPWANRIKALEAIVDLRDYRGALGHISQAGEEAERTGDFHAAEEIMELVIFALECSIDEDDLDENDDYPAVARQRLAAAQAKLDSFIEKHDEAHPECAEKRESPLLITWEYDPSGV